MKHDNDPIAACEQIVEEMPQRPGIRHGGDKALYRPWTDQVHVPRRETFISSEAYYGVLFHELTHSTGHPERLNRKTLTDGTPFGNPTYSREELVAEMGAAFLCAAAAIDDPTLQRSASYIQQLAEIPALRSQGADHRGGTSPEGRGLHPGVRRRRGSRGGSRTGRSRDGTGGSLRLKLWGNQPPSTPEWTGGHCPAGPL